MSLTEKQIEQLCQRVDDLFADAPTRIRNVLRQGPYSRQHAEGRFACYLGQLLTHTEFEFKNKIPGSSKHTAAYVEEKLQGMGYKLGALSDFRDELVHAFSDTPDETDFAERLRALPITGSVDLSVLPRNDRKNADAKWMKSHLPQELSGVSDDLVSAALDDIRVQRKFSALVDFTAQVVRERLRRENGGPQYTQDQLDLLGKKAHEIFPGSAPLLKGNPKYGSERIEYFAQLVSYTPSELSQRYNIGAIAVSTQITRSGEGFRLGDLAEYKQELTEGFNASSGHLPPAEKDAAFAQLLVNISTGALNREGGPS
jgi:hypothetical protein